MKDELYLSEEIYVWITGRKTKSMKESDSHSALKPIFKFSPVGDFFSITVFIPKAPNVFNRAMQRIILGVKYEIDIK